MDDTVPTMGALTKYFEDAKKKIEEHTFAAKEDTLAFDVETAKVNIDAYLEALKEALDASGVKIDLGKYITIDAQGIKNFDFAAFNNVLSGDKGDIGRFYTVRPSRKRDTCKILLHSKRSG